MMVNNSTNINKTKESLTSDGQQFHEYQLPFVLKGSLTSDGQQFYQYQQNKRKFNQLWSTIPRIPTKQKEV